MMNKITNTISRDKILKDITKDLIDSCCREDLWEEIDGLVIEAGQ